MQNARTGLKRLRAGAPKGSIVYDKTGSGPEAKAVHDVGIISLPDNKGHLAIAVLITNSELSQSQQEEVIAGFARAAVDWKLKR